MAVPPAGELVSLPGRLTGPAGGQQVVLHCHSRHRTALLSRFGLGCYQEVRQWLLQQNLPLMVAAAALMAVQVSSVCYSTTVLDCEGGEYPVDSLHLQPARQARVRTLCLKHSNIYFIY